MKSSIFSGTYLFHLHTTFTDGHLTIPEYFEFAVNHGISRLIFLEHIRRVPSYSVSDFIKQIEQASKKYGQPFSIGFEAKMLSDGTLDISNEHLDVADVIGIAEHGSVMDLCQMEKVLYEIIKKYSSLTHDKEIVWVHPGLGFIKRDPNYFNSNRFKELVDLAISNNISIELNLKYKHLWNDTISKLSSKIVGVDCHNKNDLQNWLNNISIQGFKA